MSKPVTSAITRPIEQPPPSRLTVNEIRLQTVASTGPTSVAMASRQSWWLWPHLLSLDAPLIAVVWQRWWASRLHAPLRGREEFILFLGVWLIYVADRLADTSGANPGKHDTRRHAFYVGHRMLMRPLAWLALAALMIATLFWLGAFEFRAGLGLAAVVGGYFWLIHGRPHRRWAIYFPKEAAVGIIFSAGTGFFVLCARRFFPPDLLQGLLFFAWLCFLNCALITKWENNRHDLRGPNSRLHAFPRLLKSLQSSCLLLALSALAVAAGNRSSTCLPLAISALLLALLNRNQSTFSLSAIRVLADAVLLTPCLWACQ